MTFHLKFRQHVLAIGKKEHLAFAQTAERFEVAIASVNAKGRVNVTGALQNNRLIDACLFSVMINGDVFHVRVTEELSGSLPAEAVIVMSNAAFDKRHNTEEV